MDPDATLTDLRESVGIVLAAADGDMDAIGKLSETAVDLAEAFSNLDVWLSKGGFLPLAWQNFGGQKQ